MPKKLLTKIVCFGHWDNHNESYNQTLILMTCLFCFLSYEYLPASCMGTIRMPGMLRPQNRRELVGAWNWGYIDICDLSLGSKNWTCVLHESSTCSELLSHLPSPKQFLCLSLLSPTSSLMQRYSVSPHMKWVCCTWYRLLCKFVKITWSRARWPRRKSIWHFVLATHALCFVFALVFLKCWRKVWALLNLGYVEDIHKCYNQPNCDTLDELKTQF